MKSIGRNRAQTHETIARANRQFHEALDEVEIQIVSRRRHPQSKAVRGGAGALKRARIPGKASHKAIRRAVFLRRSPRLTPLQLNSKSVLERDLEALRTKRLERERALQAEAEPTPAAAATGKTPPEADAPADLTSAISPSDDLGDDIVMIDSAIDFLETSAAAAAAAAAARAPSKDQRAAPTSSPLGASTSDATSLAPSSTAAGATAAAPFPDALGDSFVAVPGGDDFDSMFDDPAGAFDFSAAAAGADGADASESIDALMPGLDSLVGAAANGGAAAPAGTVAPAGLTAGGIAPVAPMSRGNSNGGAKGDEKASKELPKPTGGSNAEGAAAAAAAAQDGTGDAEGGLDANMDDLFFGDEMGNFGAGDGEIGNLEDLDSWLA